MLKKKFIKKKYKLNNNSLYNSSLMEHKNMVEQAGGGIINCINRIDMLMTLLEEKEIEIENLNIKFLNLSKQNYILEETLKLNTYGFVITYNKEILYNKIRNLEILKKICGWFSQINVLFDYSCNEITIYYILTKETINLKFQFMKKILYNSFIHFKNCIYNFKNCIYYLKNCIFNFRKYNITIRF